MTTVFGRDAKNDGNVKKKAKKKKAKKTKPQGPRPKGEVTWGDDH